MNYLKFAVWFPAGMFQTRLDLPCWRGCDAICDGIMFNRYIVRLYIGSAGASDMSSVATLVAPALRYGVRRALRKLTVGAGRRLRRGESQLHSFVTGSPVSW